MKDADARSLEPAIIETRPQPNPEPLFEEPELHRCDPPCPLPTATPDQAYTYHARTKTDAGVPGPQIQLGGQGGTGKTETSRASFPKASSSIRSKRPHRQVVLVPEHAVLGRQIVDRYRALGIDAAPLLGRDDPFNPQPDDLCTQPEAVAEALKSDLDVMRSVCGTPDGRHCPDLAGCKYHAMKARAAAAPVVVGAHNDLFRPLPKDVASGIGRLVVEEEFTTHGLRIFNLTHDAFGPAALEQWPVLYEDNHDAPATASLLRLHLMLCEAFGHGDLTAERLPATHRRYCRDLICQVAFRPPEVPIGVTRLAPRAPGRRVHCRLTRNRPGSENSGPAAHHRP